jgi:hypothetical protein
MVLFTVAMDRGSDRDLVIKRGVQIGMVNAAFCFHTDD